MATKDHYINKKTTHFWVSYVCGWLNTAMFLFFAALFLWHCRDMERVTAVWKIGKVLFRALLATFDTFDTSWQKYIWYTIRDIHLMYTTKETHLLDMGKVVYLLSAANSRSGWSQKSSPWRPSQIFTPSTKYEKSCKSLLLIKCKVFNFGESVNLWYSLCLPIQV